MLFPDEPDHHEVGTYRDGVEEGPASRQEQVVNFH